MISQLTGLSIGTNGSARPGTAHTLNASSNARTEEADAAQEQPKPANISELVTKANEVLKSQNLNVEFEIDEAKRIIMRIVNTQTREVLRQIPSEEQLEIARALTSILERVRGALLSGVA